MQDVVTTLLDSLGLLLVAAGLGYGTYGLVTSASGGHGTIDTARGAGLLVAGLVVAGGSWLADRAAGRHRGDPQ